MKPSPNENRQLLERFWHLVKPFRWYLLPALGCMIIMAATNGAIAYLIKPILDWVFINKDATMLYVLPGVVLLVFVVRGAAYFGQAYLMEFVGQKVVRGLQVSMYRHLLSMDASFFTNQGIGGLISRITYDANLLKETASTVISNILREGFTVIFLLGVLFYRDWLIAVIALTGLPAAGYLIYLFGRRMRKLSRLRQELMENVTAHLEETLSGLRIVQAFNTEPRERARFRYITKNVLKNHLKVAIVRAVSKPAIDIISGVVISGVVLLAGKAVIEGTTTTGTFFSFVTALLMAYDPIKRLTGLNNQLQTGLAAAKRIFDLLDHEPNIKDSADPIVLPNFKKQLCFENVSFSYEESQKPALSHINLTIQAGERVALVGASGGGKSTLIHLVPRFFDVSKGRITIDGIDIRMTSLSSLRNQIAMVTQEVILFNESVRANIAYGSREWREEDILKAAEAANARQFIEAFPEGFDTIIGDRGVKLSGGQRQRLSIARSILKNAPLLILDEATSALDTESEVVVQEALERLMEGRTTLVIAHRLSTIRNADRIIVIQDGCIIEEGQHETLLEKNGAYAKLYWMQFQKK
ncbi:lipid A export permease/ATP-binding protein MsbA [Magnetococcales bacterium HHB-1]